MKVLHVIATPRAAESTTLSVSRPFLEHLTAARPDLHVETLDLFATDVPALDAQHIDTKYGLLRGQPVALDRAESWGRIEDLIAQFLSAQICVISSPMWNFHVPYALKYYIDAIVQPGYLFAYENGIPVGLCQGKKMVCVTSRGSDYSTGGPMHSYDLQETYLRTIFGFVGISDMDFIHVQPADMGPDRRDASVDVGIETARRLATSLAGSTVLAG